jgi:O-antigen ligase
MFISNLLNEIPKTGWNSLFSYIYRYAFICIILIYFYSKNFFSKNTIALFILISLGIQGLDGVYQTFVGYDLFKHNIGNFSEGLTGATFNRNNFGFFMGLGVLTSYFLLIKKFSFDIKNGIFFFLLSIFIFGTLFSYSRATWVAVFICLFLHIMINYKRINLKYLIVLIVIIFSTFYLFNLSDNLLTRFHSLASGDSSNRYTIWMKAIEMTYQKPIFGWGIESWEIFGLKEYAGIHNIYLEILSSLGVLGFLIFSYFLYIIIRNIIKNKDYVLFVFLMYFLVIGGFDHSILAGKTYLASFTLLMFFIFSNNVNKFLIKEQK